MLDNAKDPIDPTMRKGGYLIPCSCGKVYIGESGRSVKVRLKEHCVDIVIHQVAQAGFPEEPPKDEQAMLIHAEFSDSAGPKKAPFSVFPLL